MTKMTYGVFQSLLMVTVLAWASMTVAETRVSTFQTPPLDGVVQRGHAVNNSGQRVFYQTRITAQGPETKVDFYQQETLKGSAILNLSTQGIWIAEDGTLSIATSDDGEQKILHYGFEILKNDLIQYRSPTQVQETARSYSCYRSSQFEDLSNVKLTPAGTLSGTFGKKGKTFLFKKDIQIFHGSSNLEASAGLVFFDSRGTGYLIQKTANRFKVLRWENDHYDRRPSVSNFTSNLLKVLDCRHVTTSGEALCKATISKKAHGIPGWGIPRFEKDSKSWILLSLETGEFSLLEYHLLAAIGSGPGFDSSRIESSDINLLRLQLQKSNEILALSQNGKQILLSSGDRSREIFWIALGSEVASPFEF